jgi:DNA-directed RNA polymerase subunit RPC12/RpoP
MKLSRFTVLGMVAVGALLLAWAGLMLFSDSGATKSGPAVVDDYHCPRCGRELPKAYVGTGECPYCQAAEARGEQAPAKTGRRPLAVTAIIPSVLVGLFVILLSTHVVLIYRSRAGRNKPEVFYHVHCGKCGRKLRYRDTQVGKVGACPLCHRPIVFPKPPRVQPAAPWWKRPWPKPAAQ